MGRQFPTCCVTSKPALFDSFDDPRTAARSVILGSGLAQQAGVMLGGPVTIIGSQLTPFSIQASLYHFRVAGIFESGLYDLDSSWAFTSSKCGSNSSRSSRRRECH